jgi:hypothetical protein
MAPRPVALTACSRMLEALSAVPAEMLARCWISAVALGADWLTYDRLDTIALVVRVRAVS